VLDIGAALVVAADAAGNAVLHAARPGRGGDLEFDGIDNALWTVAAKAGPIA
jgi:hypothetical protein